MRSSRQIRLRHRRQPARRRVPRVHPVLVALLVGAAGCGSGLSKAELDAANGAFTSQTIVQDAGPADPTAPGADSFPTGGNAGVGAGLPLASEQSSTPAGGRGARSRSGADVARTSGTGGGPATGAGPATARPAPDGGSSAERPSSSGARTGGPGTATGGATGGGATGGGASGTGAGGAPATRELLFGSFGTASGPIGAQLAAIPVAIRAWVAAVNARGGVAGRPVRVIFGDDGGDPGKALAIARRMVEEDKIIAFFATFGATTIQAVTPYLEQRQVPVVGSEGGNPVEDQSPMVFNPQVGADVGVTRALVTTLVEQSPARKIAVVYCREATTCSNSANRIKEYAPVRGLSVVYEAAVSLAQPDYTAEMLSAERAGAEAVLVYIDVASMIRVERSAHRQGWRPVFVGGVSVNEEGFTKGGDEVEGTLLSSATVPYSTSPKLADYREAVTRHVPGGALGGTGASAWVQGKLLERLLAGISGDVTAARLLDALYALKDETLGGVIPPITFPRGPHGTVNLCTVPLKMSGGRITAPLGDRFVCAA